MRRRLTPEDLARINGIVRDNVQQWVGIGTFLILTQLEQMENRIMATLEDDAAAVAALQAQVDALGADIQLLIDAFNADIQLLIDAFNAQAAGTLTAEQQAQVDAIAASTASTSAAVTAEEAAVEGALNPPPPTP